MDNTEKKKLCYSVKMSDINVTRVPEKKKRGDSPQGKRNIKINN